MAKVGRGRPAFKITQEIIDKAESLSAAGLTKEEIAHCLNISYQTLNEKSKINADFSEAITRGRSKGIGMMANNLVKLAKGGNAAANIFWLKARAKWKERDEEVEDILTKASKMLDEVKEIANKCLQTPNK
jgi:hypothetical protein